jgi:hypothetical protein
LLLGVPMEPDEEPVWALLPEAFVPLWEAEGLLCEADGFAPLSVCALDPTFELALPVCELAPIELELPVASGVLLEEDDVPGVLLLFDDCEDCDPHLELSDELLEGEEVALEELLVCGLLLEVESGVEVLLPALPVCALLLEGEEVALEELLVCGLLLEVESGVEVLLVLLPTLPVCALLLEVLGVLLLD